MCCPARPDLLPPESIRGHRASPLLLPHTSIVVQPTEKRKRSVDCHRSIQLGSEPQRGIAGKTLGCPWTSGPDWTIVIRDLAIEDIRASKYRGTTGTLASTKTVCEASCPGAKLITRRSQVPRPAAWAGESWPRYRIGDPRPFEPRISFCPLTRFQPDSAAIAMLRSDSRCRANNYLIPGSRRGIDIAPNLSPPGSLPFSSGSYATSDMHGTTFICVKPLAICLF
jgi:hypothetical protein